MLFFSLPARARTLILWLIAVPVLIVIFLVPDADSASRGPLGQVIEQQDDQLTVRTSDGRLHTVPAADGSARHCLPGNTYPSCLNH
ncbi:hypothetical protein WKI65_44345 [Streptomyces sp. MS1.AVA.3]|uniref:hypothetical protein n=1 Tax=Streptomyces decoyicus TaxID=249567 RepID=UPI0030BC89CD